MNYEERYKNKYWISRYLDLIFKKIAQLEEGSGGGSQNLQQTLDNGSEATLVDKSFVINNSSTGFGETFFDLGGNGLSVFSGNGGTKGTSFNASGEQGFSVSREVSSSPLMRTEISITEPTALNQLSFPDKSGTLATTSDIPVKIVDQYGSIQYAVGEGEINFNLQYSSDDPIPDSKVVVGAGNNNLVIQNGSARIQSLNENGGKFDVLGEVEDNKVFIFRYPTTKPEGDYTLAVESPISGTFANPTSITVVNGIITAIS